MLEIDPDTHQKLLEAREAMNQHLSEMVEALSTLSPEEMVYVSRVGEGMGVWAEGAQLPEVEKVTASEAIEIIRNRMGK